MMLKLKLQYFGHLMRRADSLEKTLMLGGIGGRDLERGTESPREAYRAGEQRPKVGGLWPSQRVNGDPG